MHVYYKFGLLLIFILSVSTYNTRAAPSTNQSSTFDDYPDDYADYYYDNEGYPPASASATSTSTAATPTTTTTHKSLLSSIEELLDIPKRSNHVLEPTCPTVCRCMEDFKYIDCANGRLTAVPNDLPHTAVFVNLSRNLIADLHERAFENLSKLQEIDLSYNQLTQLDKVLFASLKRLERLHLENNLLNQIDPDTFAGAVELRKLYLSNNTIALRDDGSFLNQPQLQQLHCNNCTWTVLHDETFANMTGLQTLMLNQNDFNKQINTKAFGPLRNLIKLKLPELEQASIYELCNLLKSIDNISFSNFNVSCFELVLGTSFDESIKLASPTATAPATTTDGIANSTTLQSSASAVNMTSNGSGDGSTYRNFTLPPSAADDNSTDIKRNVTAGILTAGGILGVGDRQLTTETAVNAKPDNEQAYQVPVSTEAIHIMLICIMVFAIIGIVVGMLFRKDIGGIKTKCCRTRKPEPKDQVHPAEEIPLNKLA